MQKDAIKRYSILGTPVDAVTMDSALGFVERAVAGHSPPQAILAVNPEKIFALREDAFLRKFFEGAGLLIPDGIGIVKGLRLLFRIEVSRVPGADLMQRICAAAPERGYRIFIYGASEEVNIEACRTLEQRFPGIRIVGHANGFVPQSGMPELIQAINRSEADILFVALGSPRQERWMSEHFAELKTVKVCQGIGGTLDTIVGRVKRAPVVWQKLGLEWFFRLLCQPSRFKRQLRCFVFAGEIIKLKVFGPRNVIADNR